MSDYLNTKCAFCGYHGGAHSGHCAIAISKFNEPPGDEQKETHDAMSLAQDLAKKWWSDGKISHNWHPTLDVIELAYVIEHKRLP